MQATIILGSLPPPGWTGRTRSEGEAGAPNFDALWPTRGSSECSYRKAFHLNLSPETSTEALCRQGIFGGPPSSKKYESMVGCQNRLLQHFLLLQKKEDHRRRQTHNITRDVSEDLLLLILLFLFFFSFLSSSYTSSSFLLLILYFSFFSSSYYFSFFSSFFRKKKEKTEEEEKEKGAKRTATKITLIRNSINY